MSSSSDIGLRTSTATDVGRTRAEGRPPGPWPPSRWRALRADGRTHPTASV